MSETRYNLRPMWDALLDLYVKFDAFCKANGLRYYVTGGTLLGAVRHNGFIPWDDDFDVVMPRPDFLRFVKLGDQFPEGTWLSYCERNPAIWIDFAQFYEGRKEINERIRAQTHLDIKWGLYIDVIPIDGMPRATIPFYWWAFKRSLWRKVNHGGGFWRRLLARFLRMEYRGSAGRAALAAWLASYDYEKSPCVEDYNANARRFKARALTSRSFGVPVMHKFDKLEVPMPQEWEKFLTLIYGDYMRLPPEDKRTPIHNVI